MPTANQMFEPGEREQMREILRKQLERVRYGRRYQSKRKAKHG